VTSEDLARCQIMEKTLAAAGSPNEVMITRMYYHSGLGRK
jgi:hypothetical protein